MELHINVLEAADIPSADVMSHSDGYRALLCATGTLNWGPFGNLIVK